MERKRWRKGTMCHKDNFFQLHGELLSEKNIDRENNAEEGFIGGTTFK